MRKRVSGHTRTDRPRSGCGVWSGPLPFAYRIIGYYKLNKWNAKARRMIFCASAGWSESVRFTQVWSTFSLEPIKKIIRKSNILPMTQRGIVNKLWQTARATHFLAASSSLKLLTYFCMEKCLRACAKCADLYHPAKSHSGICSALKHSAVSNDSILFEVSEWSE